MSALELAGLLPLAFWLLVALDRRRRWPVAATLPCGDAGGPPPDARVVAVVPARDEAELLPDTLPALLDQGVPVVLVDDGSRDGTARVASALAGRRGGSERLRVVAAPPRPAGWTGKPWALANGVAAAEAWQAAEWLLLSDADIVHRPGSAAALVARAAAGSHDLVSVMARLRTETFWERLLMPPFVFFFQLLYPFRRVAAAESRVAAAAGGCVLVRRAALARAGGIAAIRGAVIDDVALARAVKRSGGRLWLGLDGGIRSLRPYPRLADLWQMVSRSAFVQLRQRLDLLLVAVAGLLCCVAAPPIVLGLAAGGLAGAAPAAPLSRAGLLAGLAWMLQARALLPAVRYHRLAAIWAWGLPAAAVLYALMTISSAWRYRSGRGGRWKGRAVAAPGRRR